MKLICDPHCHTIASGHAYSTVDEIAREAAKKELELIAITDHCVRMPGAPHIYHFWNLDVIPDYIYGVRVLRGVETNILDVEGTIDMDKPLLKRMEIVLASMHDNCFIPMSQSENTAAYINVMKNPYVDIIAHSGNPAYPINISEFVDAAKYYDKIIEINNCSLKGNIRAGSKQNCNYIITECMKKGVDICASTDSHIAYDIGEFDNVYKFLESIPNLNEDLVLSTSKEKLIKKLNIHGKNIKC